MSNPERSVDLHALRGSLILLCLTTLLTVSTLLASHWYKSRLAEAQHEQVNRLRSLQSTEQKTRESGRIYKNYYGRYQQLQKLGLIGDESRALWIEALRKSAQQTAPFGLEYQISEQQDYEGQLGIEQTRFNVRKSVMSIKLSLAHEYKLLTFLDLLEKQHSGFFNVQHCSLIPEFKEQGISPWQANISAECQLNWYTLAPVQAVMEEDAS